MYFLIRSSIRLRRQSTPTTNLATCSRRRPRILAATASQAVLTRKPILTAGLRICGKTRERKSSRMKQVGRLRKPPAAAVEMQQQARVAQHLELLADFVADVA